MDEEEEAFLGKGGKSNATADAPRPRIYDSTDHSEIEHAGRASSPELGRTRSPGRHSGRLTSIQDYSGNEITSYSEWSDGPASNTSTYVKSKSSFQNLSASAPSSTQPPLPRDQNRVVDAATPRDPERVICNGYLQCLRIKGSVRQWKRLWVVLRPKSLSFYKDDQVGLTSLSSSFLKQEPCGYERESTNINNQQEYSAVRIIPMEQVIDAAEIDPMSRSKQNCIQIIAEEKSYRLCTEDEESLAKWLGSLKSILVARKKSA